MPDDLFTTMTERYRSGNLPWADALPPPEIVGLCEALLPGRALDLGCGLARSCIYLAQRGWQCEGVDFVPEAIAQARERVIAAGAADRVTLHVGPVLQSVVKSARRAKTIDRDLGAGGERRRREANVLANRFGNLEAPE